MISDHRIVVSKVLWEQRKVGFLSKGQCKMIICKYAKFEDGKLFSYKVQRRLLWPLVLIK